MPPFCFGDSGSSLLSLLIFTIITILFQVDCLFPLLFFGFVGFFLAPSSLTYFFAISFFFFLRSGAVFLSYWLFSLRLSTLEFCRLLGRPGSWCWDEDLHETSLWWIFPGVWGSLLVQWFELGAPTTGASPQPPAHEPRSCKPRGTEKKEKREQ